MKVGDFLEPARRSTKKSKLGRNRTTYRAARRNIAKTAYRVAKRKKAV